MDCLGLFVVGKVIDGFLVGLELIFSKEERFPFAIRAWYYDKSSYTGRPYIMIINPRMK